MEENNNNNCPGCDPNGNGSLCNPCKISAQEQVKRHDEKKNKPKG